MMVENDGLESLRQTTSRILVAVLWLHVPISVTIGLALGKAWLIPAIFMTIFALAATLSWRMSGNGLSTRLVFSVALMSGVSMFTWQFEGNPWQIDMHMYFFAALACIVAYCDYRAIAAATVAVALHHIALNFVLPAAIYPGGSDFGRVVLHAAILLIEAGVLIALAHKLQELFETTAVKTAEAQAAMAAEARANRERSEVEQRAKQDREAAKQRLADNFERSIGGIVEAVAIAAGEVQHLSSAMSSNSADTARAGPVQRPQRRTRPRAMSRPSPPRPRSSPRRSAASRSRSHAPQTSRPGPRTRPAAPIRWSKALPAARRRSARSSPLSRASRARPICSR
ncbi:hypothetical protein [Bradyrhizobium japonicum]